MQKIQIRNNDLPKHPRMFDVMVDERGNIVRYIFQNIKGAFQIDHEEVKRQIKEYCK